MSINKKNEANHRLEENKKTSHKRRSSQNENNGRKSNARSYKYEERQNNL